MLNVFIIFSFQIPFFFQIKNFYVCVLNFFIVIFCVGAWGGGGGGMAVVNS